MSKCQTCNDTGILATTSKITNLPWEERCEDCNVGMLVSDFRNSAACAIYGLLNILENKSMSTHDLHDIVGGTRFLSLTLLKGLLHEAEVRKHIKFDPIDKVWCI